MCGCGIDGGGGLLVRYISFRRDNGVNELCTVGVKEKVSTN